MSQKTIELAGIVRNLPDNTVPDGSMQEIINLRPKDGAWRPVGPKASSTPVPTDVRFIHTINDDYKVVVGVNAGYLAYWVYLNGTYNATVTTSISVGTDVLKFTQSHNTLIVGNNTDKTISLLFFDLTTLVYNIINELPDVPEVLVFLDPGGFTDPVFIPLTIVTDGKEALASGTKLIADNTKLALSGPVFIRLAWEMTDGSIVKHSNVIRTTTSFLEVDYLPPPDDANRGIYWRGRHVYLQTTLNTYERGLLSVKYKGIITSLNIYVSRMQPLIPGGYSSLTPAFLQPSIIDVDNFYLVQQIPLASLNDYLDTNLNGRITGPFENMETRDTLPVDNFTNHKIHGNNLFTYNDRIFWGDITTHLYKGYNAMRGISKVTGGTTGAAYDIGIEVSINSRDGIKTVFSGWETCNYYDAAGTSPAIKTNYLTYPDSRAIMFKIIGRQSDELTVIANLPATSIPYNNISVNTGNGELVFTLGTFSGVALTTVNGTYADPNRIQASELSNPFYFPAKNSYRVQGQVLGMSTNAIALSQGQFGQFPVYCFTSEGIWTMNIGNGDVLINTITPLSREVCNNPDGITQIDGGTVFSTAKGLYILQGTQAIEISQAVEGNHLSRLSGTLNYEAIANNPNLYQVKDFLCSATILTYLSGAKIAWDHIHKELIVSNPTPYKYSWVYNLEYKRWFKISQVFDSFVQDFPHTYGYNTISTVYTKYTLTEENYDQLIPVHMETRPIKLSPVTFKKINRALIGGFINNNLEFPFSVNLFGSPDKRSWYLLNASNTFGARSQLLIGRTTFSCTYYIVIIGGKVDEEAYFTHVDVDFDETYGNKLR